MPGRYDDDGNYEDDGEDQRDVLQELSEIQEPLPESPEIASEETRTSASPTSVSQYTHSWENGLLLQKPRSTTHIANWRTTLLNVTTIYDEDGDDPKQVREVRFERTPDDAVVLRLTTEDMESDRALQKRLAVLPPLYRVYSGGWSHIAAAMSEFAEHQHFGAVTAFASMGWVKDYTTFVLPGMPHGMTADGFDDQASLDSYAIRALHTPMRQYGGGVRLPRDAAERQSADALFCALLQLHPLSGVAVTQVLAGPLSPFGARETPPLIHIQGLRGSFKTPLMLLCMSLLGNFKAAPESWVSSEATLMRRLYEARHVTLFIDDFKKSTVEVDPTKLVQSYYDGTTRNRMAPDQSNRVSLIPRGLLLSAGEDTWESSGSMDARTILLATTRPSENEAETWRDAFSSVRDRQPLLGVIGGLWLQWLARIGRDELIKRLSSSKRDHMARISARDADVDTKMVATNGTLLAAADLVQQFCDEMLPLTAAVYRDAVQQTTETLMQSAEVTTEASTQLDPYNAVRALIQSALSSRKAFFLHRVTSQNEAIGSTDKGAECIGWFDDENVYLTNERTYSWLLREARLEGRTVPFTWRGFAQGVHESLGPWEHNGKDQRINYVLSARSNVMRALVLPRSLFDVFESESASESESEQESPPLWEDTGDDLDSPYDVSDLWP